MNDNIKKGSITMIIGPMFSGKTSELIRLIKRAEIAKKRCLVLKYSKDLRYSNKVITHDLIDKDCILTSDLIDIYNDFKSGELIFNDYDVIAIDEGSFIKNIELVNKWADYGKIIYIAALDSDYKRNPFQSIVNLVSTAENVIKLTAICTCGDEASFSKRIITDDNIELIGGKESYNSVCRGCYNAI
jgi:thymidine kinase